MTTMQAVVTTATVLALAVCTAAAQEQSAEDTNRGWTALDRRGFNAIWVLRTTGDLFISNGKTVHVSRDGGRTWEEPVERAKKGRHYNSIGFDADWEGERLALFPIDNPVGWMTLDGGETWSTFAKPTPPQVNKHDGWTYGAVSWDDEEPARMFGKEHHTTNLWLSTDAGQNWTRIRDIGGYFGIGFGADGALLVGATVDERSNLPSDAEKGGIYRSADDGQTWELVFEAELDQKVKPQTFDGTVYWPTTEGLAVSEDGGTEWALMEDSPKGCCWGPFFGRTDDTMVVVNAEGVHRTTDGGQTWQMILARQEMPGPVANANFKNIMPNFAWDPQRDVLYATSMGVGLYRRELGE